MEFHAEVLTRRYSNHGQKSEKRVRKFAYDIQLLDWLCSQKYSTQILMLRYAYTTDIYLTVCGVLCRGIDQKVLKSRPKVGKTCTKICL